VCAFLTAVTFAPSLAHVLERPGKLRLAEEQYRSVQTIYYPGFTVAGAVGEFGGSLATIALLLLTPAGTMAFWLTFVALLCYAALQAIYWIVLQPLNRRWLARQELGRMGAGFFSVGGAARGSWVELRDRWEHAHALRAVFASAALLAMLALLRFGR
jgi:hypothetical protein